MIAVLWRYKVKVEHRADFERVYGPAGEWATLFARSHGYRGTDLLRSRDGGDVTIDRWMEEKDFHAFLAEHQADYRDLDSRTAGWTSSEERLGLFELVS